ncbi:protein STRUBBELIG-RECEPTOR FAMILY 7 [Neltuma alba]|uniref:protein STRUBBELIG-RECEPTOR FAMILY 7 n=1 Tax=Neltuma alba TaxID=207710 RepID=UPI0010A4D094|nr:protein STRUBBELIG-RECEPTOR FAMILY 7-like [Prosopis alba]
MFGSMNSPSQLGWPASGDDACGQHWKGISCSGNRVTEIKLPGLGLTGTLGYQLQTLTSVINLDMSNNNLGAPYHINFLPNVQRLNLTNN